MRVLTRLVLIMLVCSSSMMFADSFGSPNFVLYGITSLLINDSLDENTVCAVGNIGGASVKLDKCKVQGDVHVPTAGAFTKGSHGAITGTVMVGSLAAINSQLTAESAALAAMMGMSLGAVTTNLTLGPGVYSATSINFSGGNRSITLNGAGKYIFNVSGTILWAASKLILENGATASNVIFNITGTGNSVWNKDTTTWHATILDPRGNVEIHNAWPFGNFTGQVFANNINFHSGATIVQPPPQEQVPEPSISILLLFGMGLVAAAEVLRRMAAARLGHSAGKVLGVEPMQV